MNLVEGTPKGTPHKPQERLAYVVRRSNGGLLMKPWKETVLGERGSHIQLPAPPVIVTVDSAVGTPMGELPDRKEFVGLHSSNNVEHGKARRRSLGEGLG